MNPADWTLSREERADRILDNLSALPSPSPVVVRVLALLNDPDASVDELGNVIRTDPAITASVLRLANSSYFGHGRQVASLSQAVMVIGTRRLFDVVASATLARIVPAHMPCYDLHAPSFWKHCVSVAVLAEQVARELALPAPDMLFTAGLLHDVGKMAIGLSIGADDHSIEGELAVGGATLVTAEREVLGVDHAELGARLAARWDLPQLIVDAARWHHEPDDAPDGVDRQVVDIIHVADALAHALGLGADIGELRRRVSNGAGARLLISPSRLESIACEGMDTIDAIAGSISPKAGD